MVADPHYILAAEIWALRGERARPARFAGLYVQGTIEALAGPTVAIVGTRAASEQGRRIAWRFAAELGRAGVCVISGLAVGIDAAAHAGSISADAATIGLLGGGHRRFFPPRNRELAAAMIAKGGAVISPFAPNEPAYPARFLQRNGVIAALSDAVVVIEAAARSGALNTAAWAAASSVPVLAVPGDIERAKVAGCHALIRDGATLVRDHYDILEAIGVTAGMRAPVQQTTLPFPVDSVASRLAHALRDEPLSAEMAAERHGLSIGETLAALAHLTFEGIAEIRSDGFYALVT
jgi:DNA processing protein